MDQKGQEVPVVRRPAVPYQVRVGPRTDDMELNVDFEKKMLGNSKI